MFFRKTKWKAQLKTAYESKLALAYVKGWAERKNLAVKNQLPIWEIMIDNYRTALQEGPITGDAAINLVVINRSLRDLCGDGGPVMIPRNFDDEFQPGIGWNAWLNNQISLNSN